MYSDLCGGVAYGYRRCSDDKGIKPSLRNLALQTLNQQGGLFHQAVGHTRELCVSEPTDRIEKNDSRSPRSSPVYVGTQQELTAQEGEGWEEIK